MQDDWRITDQMDYMFRISLMKAHYKATPTNDHDHCEFCFDEFSEEPDCLHVGYCTPDQYRWICEECFSDFHEAFEWTVLADETADG